MEKINQLWIEENVHKVDVRNHMRVHVCKELCELGKLLGPKAINYPRVFQLLEQINIGKEFPYGSTQAIVDGMIERASFKCYNPSLI